MSAGNTLRDHVSRRAFLKSTRDDRLHPMFVTLALLGLRRSELLGLRWEDVDFTTAWWTNPASRAKNGRSHRVPLSPEALSILNERREGDPEDEGGTSADRPGDRGKGGSGWRWRGSRSECFFRYRNRCFTELQAACRAAKCDDSRCKHDESVPSVVTCAR